MLFPAPWGNYALKELAETTRPPAIDWWPQTVAWQVLLLLVIFWFFNKGYKSYKAYKKDAYRREAVTWISKLPSYNDELPAVVFRQLPALLRHTAIVGFGRSEVSILSNKNWELWLDEQCLECNFSQKHTRLLQHLAYAPTIEISKQQMASLIDQITSWIKNHRRHND